MQPWRPTPISAIRAQARLSRPARRTTQAQQLRRRRKPGRKLGLPFIEVDDLLDAEPLGHAEEDVKEGISDETGEGTDRVNGNGHSNDKENVADGEDEEIIEVKGAIFSLSGGGFTGAATSIRTQQMLRNLLKTRRAATSMASIVEQSSNTSINAFRNGGKNCKTHRSIQGS